MAVNLEVTRKSTAMDMYFMKFQQDKEDRKRPAPQPPPPLSFTGFMVASFDGFVDIPAMNPTLMFRGKELRETKPKSEAASELKGRSRNFSMTKDRATSSSAKNSSEREPSRPRSAIQRVNLKLHQLKESDILMSQLQMRVAAIKSLKTPLECEKVRANLDVVASLQKIEQSAAQQNEKRKNRVAAMVEAARKSDSLRIQIQKEMEEKEDFRSRAKERYMEKQAKMNLESRQMLLLTVCACVARSWWWLDLGRKHMLVNRNWMQTLRAAHVLRKCAKIFLWKCFLKKKSHARSRLAMLLPDKVRRWATNRYNKAVRTLIISIQEWQRCNRYKILAKMYLTRMFRIQRAIRFARLRQLARAECNWMILQNHLNSLIKGGTNGDQLNATDEDGDELQPSSKRLHWLLKVGELAGICRAVGPGHCLAAIITCLSSSLKLHVRCIDDWKDMCLKKRKLGFKWMPPRPKYKFLMTPQQLQSGIIEWTHGLLHKEIIVAATGARIEQKKRRDRGPSKDPVTPKC
jgi:hypothetical protein